MKITYETVKAQIGGMSMIGPGRERPTSWGNYFWLRDPQYRVVNFWAENLEALVDTGILADGMVRVKVYDKKWCLIDDDCVPGPAWYHDDLCFTGGYVPDLEILQDMYDTHGDPNNEIERYVNPKSYYEKRGHYYKDLGRGFSLQYNVKESFDGRVVT